MTVLEWSSVFGNYWAVIRDGDSRGRKLYERHYSCRRYADKRKPKLFVGPAEKLCLMTPDAKALFAWRRFIDRSGQEGVNCAIFRNEGAFDGLVLSSELIIAAESFAWQRWPAVRFYTYVDPLRVKSSNPGFCFKRAGWNECGRTKVRKLIILEKHLG